MNTAKQAPPKNIGVVMIQKDGRLTYKYIEHLTPTIVQPIEYRRNAARSYSAGDWVTKALPEFGTEVYRHCGRLMDSQGRHTMRHIFAHTNWSVGVITAMASYAYFDQKDYLVHTLSEQIVHEGRAKHPEARWLGRIWIGNGERILPDIQTVTARLMVYYPSEAAKAVASADAEAGLDLFFSDHA